MLHESDGSDYNVLRVVRTLSMPYEGQGHVLFMDEYYNTIGVFVYLLKVNIFECGTFMKNRLRLDNELFRKLDALEHRNSLFFTDINKGMLITCWKDRKMVTLVSTYHNNQIVEEYEKYYENGKVEKTKFNIPLAVKDYRKYMGGVDLYDQFLFILQV
jgi:hypothetical protein